MGKDQQSQQKSKQKPKTANSTPSSQLQSKLDKAVDLESKLSTLSATKCPDEETISQLRIQLCEFFSDVLLTDPGLASRKDVSGRLWRSCFYGRIGELRARISKEKSRLRKLRKKSSGGDHSVATADLTKQSKCVKTFEERLKVFLSEAVVLYEYLVDQFQGMLLPKIISQSSQSQSQSQSQRSPLVEKLDQPVVQKGVVLTLHRLFIHLGDLHRYSCTYPSAESAYQKASCLAPGKGNPYNQLAVVAQLKESSGAHPLPAVALYWYCRSLLAVHDAFETSRSNVERLFVANKKWIQQNITEDDKKNELEICTAGTSREKGRAMKSIASRKFLSLFVDFHANLFTAMVNNADETNEIFAGMEKDIDYLVRQFDVLLTESAFGDSLLFKMVSINAFSLWNGLSFLSSPPSSPDGRDLLCLISISFIFQFGVQLSRHTLGFLEKLESKQQQQQQQSGATKNSSSSGIRLISPLLLLCDFISYMLKRNREINELRKSVSKFEDKTRQLFLKSEKEFWNIIANLGNVLKSSSFVSKLLKRSEVCQSHASLPDDFKLIVRGYAPFAFLENGEVEFEESSLITMLYKKNKSKQESDAYLTFEDSVDALELYPESTQSQMSQRSKKALNQIDTRHPNQSELQTRLKLVRFLKFIRRHVDSGDIIEIDEDGEVVFSVDDRQKADCESSVENHLAMDWDTQTKDYNDHKSADNTENDIVVYKAAGNGPALLVPGALLLSGNEKREKTPEKSSPKLHEPIVLMELEDDKEDKLNSSSGLLNLETLLNQTAPGSVASVNDVNISAEEGNCESANKSSLQNGSSLFDQQAVLQPIQQISSPKSPSKVINVTTIRPPPGFNNTKPSLNTFSQSNRLLPPSLESKTPVNFPCVEPCEKNVFISDAYYSGLTPFPQAFQPSGSSTIHAFSDTCQSNSQLPSISQTRNPFAYPMPPLGNNNNGLQELTSSSSKHMPSNSQPFPPQAAPLENGNHLRNYLPQNLIQNNIVDVRDKPIELELEPGNDLFGLRSLGLFEDKTVKNANNGSYLTAQDMPPTKNPFAFD